MPTFIKLTYDGAAKLETYINFDHVSRFTKVGSGTRLLVEQHVDSMHDGEHNVRESPEEIMALLVKARGGV